MLNYFICVSAFMLFRGIISFCLNRKHFLLILLRLEFIVLSLYFIIFLYLNFYSYELYFRIIFLIIRVCEGALGLSILVSLIRSHGNDYVQSFNLLW